MKDHQSDFYTLPESALGRKPFSQPALEVSPHPSSHDNRVPSSRIGRIQPSTSARKASEAPCLPGVRRHDGCLRLDISLPRISLDGEAFRGRATYVRDKRSVSIRLEGTYDGRASVFVPPGCVSHIDSALTPPYHAPGRALPFCSAARQVKEREPRTATD